MDKQNRLMFLLAAVLLALVALIVLLEPPDEAGEEQGEESWQAAFDGVEAHEVESFEVQLGDETRRFVRHEDGWRLAAPLQVDAADDPVEALLDSLVGLEVGEPLDGAAEEYGLQVPAATVRMTLQGGRTLGLQVGRDAPVGWHSYVQVEGLPGIRASRSRLSATLGTPLDDYREKALWRFAVTAVDRVRLAGPLAVVELRRDAGDWWVRAALADVEGQAPELAGPEVRADEAVVDAALADLGALRAQGFLPGPAGDGLDWSVTIDAAGSRQELRAGPLGGSWVASAPLQETGIVLPEGWLDDFLVPVPEWWADDLLSIDEEAGLRLEVRLGEQQASGALGAAGWEPESFPRVVQALRAVMVDRSPVEAAGAPWGEIRLVGTDGAARVLHLHQETADGGRVVRDEAGGAAFTVSGLELGRLVTALGD